jgi:murein DD-endopeptidase MepM/ murein hydrolase activator NlpD
VTRVVLAAVAAAGLWFGFVHPEQAPAAASGSGSPARASCPVAGARLTSGWGPRWGRFHDGVDLAAPLGTPIRAVLPGTVTYSGRADGYGQMINVRHADGSTAQYGHMRVRYAAEGVRVRAGQRIADVGAEGESTGPHLHLRIYQGRAAGTGVNPVPWLRARGLRLPCGGH